MHTSYDPLSPGRGLQLSSVRIAPALQQPPCWGGGGAFVGPMPASNIFICGNVHTGVPAGRKVLWIDTKILGSLRAQFWSRRESFDTAYTGRTTDGWI